MKGYLRYFGFSDRVLYYDRDNLLRQGWAGFWDWDHPDPPQNLQEIADDIRRSLLVFYSGGGFHMVALDVRSWQEKVRWAEAWRTIHWKHKVFVDYPIERDAVLRISSKKGSRPHLVGAYKSSAMFPIDDSASTFHLDWIKKNINSLDEIRWLYPKNLKTWGRIRVYSSD